MRRTDWPLLFGTIVAILAIAGAAWYGILKLTIHLVDCS